MAEAKLCAVEGCGKIVSKGIHCSGHGHRLKRYGDPTYMPPKRNAGKCKVEGCDTQARTMGWCVNHYGRWKRNGDPLAGNHSPGESLEWLKQHVDFEGPNCLFYPFQNVRYGKVQIDGKSYNANRIMCTMAHGDPPTPEHEAAHLCGNGHLACVHPQHLEWKTSTENQADRLAHDTHVRGERCKTSKLKVGQVRVIRSLKGTNTSRELAVRFGVDRSAIKAIWARRTWAWLD
ncbi:hypothetical protein G6M04_14385 [Agrobacterium rhizogenes]|uniref:hypothetical protein n=1 Tax=Rhizobium rhizogenes TaxID=359 RepID=UPI0015734024|nr:hypothetical protein [Rhizobium rhizogenes]NTG48577.1 hypothetical protein [Rhizobium rhizogenes]